jgi:ABC-type antimicrobial peptide transport system permease subunit
MKKIIIQYFNTSIYNIMHHKAYALFCILGTAITFIFVSFLIQIGTVVGGNYPPAILADRTIRMESFSDEKGNNIGGISPFEIDPLLENLQEYEAVSTSGTDGLNVYINGHFFIAMVAFVNAGFWDVYNFKFVAGRPFSQGDWDNRKMYAVISKNFSRKYFNTTNSIGNKIDLMGYEYEITGVVDDVSLLSSPTQGAQIWMPSSFTGTSNNTYTDILFPTQTDMDQAKERLSRAITQHFTQKNITIQAGKEQFHTLKEQKLRKFGGSLTMTLGLFVGIILLIPAVNIVTLNSSYANNMAEVIAIRRTFGAGRLSSFFQLMLENFFLVVMGTVIGLLLVAPVFSMIQDSLLSASITGGVSLITGIDFRVIAIAILPMMLLFLFMSGGIPAYRTAKRNIADVLKGDVR